MSLQISVTKRARALFKADAAKLELEMSSLGQIVLEWLHEQVEEDALPADLKKKIDDYKAAKDGGATT